MRDKTQHLILASKDTHMTLGGETESSNPSRLIFSIKIPVLHNIKTTFRRQLNLMLNKT